MEAETTWKEYTTLKFFNVQVTLDEDFRMRNS